APALPPVAATGQQVLFGLLMVDGVPVGAVVLEVARAEADEDFVPPRPNAVIRRPTAEAPRLGVNFHMGQDRMLARNLGGLLQAPDPVRDHTCRLLVHLV